MREIYRHWIRLLMVAAIVFASGLGGLLAHSGATGNAGTQHELGLVLTESVSAASGWHDCDGPIHTGAHCGDVHCCASHAQPVSSRLNLSAPIRGTFAEWSPVLRYGHFSYNLLRPPIAIA